MEEVIKLFAWIATPPKAVRNDDGSGLTEVFFSFETREMFWRKERGMGRMERDFRSPLETLSPIDWVNMWSVYPEASSGFETGWMSD